MTLAEHDNTIVGSTQTNDTQQIHAGGKSLALFGSTGSIGTSTLDVIRHSSAPFEVYCLSAYANAKLLFEQIKEFRPRCAVIGDAEQYDWLARACLDEKIDCEIMLGADALDQVAISPQVDIVMAAIVGSAGLRSTFAAVSAGKKVLLANKEALVMAGQLMIDAAAKSNAQLLPVDSEHNAIFQCLQNTAFSQQAKGLDQPKGLLYNATSLAQRGISKLLLTGSGGPFRILPLSEFASVTPEQACNHPNWSMGRKISVDSATMMNKGLELIEACWLFNCTERDVEIVIHPESVVHSMVEFIDGSVIAQLGQPDMRTPIAHTLAWPERISTPVKSIDWQQLNGLTFQQPDYQRFPALTICRDVAAVRGNASVLLNAANEVAVDAFLEGKIQYLDIVALVEHTLSLDYGAECSSIEALIDLDQRARDVAAKRCNQLVR